MDVSHVSPSLNHGHGCGVAYPPAFGHADEAPKVKTEVNYTFTEESIKGILMDYVRSRFNVAPNAELTVTSDYKEGTYFNQFDSSPGYCRFTVKETQ